MAMIFIISASIALLSAFSAYLQFKKESEDNKEKLEKEQELKLIYKELNQKSSQIIGSTNKVVDLQSELLHANRKIEHLQNSLIETQKSILKNTERSLQPFTVSSFQISLEYTFDNPIIEKSLKLVNDLKKELEDAYSKAPASVNGQRTLPSIPGVITFEEIENENKIKWINISGNQQLLRSCEFEIPIAKVQLFKEFPKGNGSFSMTTPIVFEFNTTPNLTTEELTSFTVDYERKKIIVHIAPKKWEYTMDSGDISSFTDLFNKFLMISVYYPSWQNNQVKLDIISMILINDKKRLQFIFTQAEKTFFRGDLNSAYIHQIHKKDFLK